jgi:ribosomal protein L37AE/L43A
VNIILGKTKKGHPTITATRSCGGCEKEAVETGFMGGFWICRNCGNNTGAADLKQIRQAIKEQNEIPNN